MIRFSSVNLCALCVSALDFSSRTLNALLMNVLALPPNPPKRTNPKPGKRHCEANCHPYASKASLSSVIFRILMRHRCATAEGHDEKNKACNLQPYLLHHFA